MVQCEKWYIHGNGTYRNKANNIMNTAHKITHENNEQIKETFKCYSVLFKPVRQSRNRCKHNTDRILDTHTVPTDIWGGLSLPLKRYTYKAAGGCSLTS